MEGLDWRALKEILEKQDGEGAVDWIYLPQVTQSVKGSREHSNVPSGFINCWEFSE